jgi:hypothetical protein
LDEENLTKSKVAAAIRAVGRWKILAQQYEASEMLTRVEDAEGKLKEFIERLGVDVLSKGLGEGGKCTQSH